MDLYIISFYLFDLDGNRFRFVVPYVSSFEFFEMKRWKKNNANISIRTKLKNGKIARVRYIRCCVLCKIPTLCTVYLVSSYIYNISYED